MVVLVKKDRYRGRWSVTVNLKATDWVALCLVKIRRTVRVDIRETGSFQKTTEGGGCLLRSAKLHTGG